MRKNPWNHLIILILVLTSIIPGCSNDNSVSQYNKSAKEFYTIYFEILESIDSDNTLESLEKLQKDENIKKLDKLGILVKDIKANIPKGKEQKLSYIDKRYNNLIFIKESYPKFKSLSVDDKIKIDSILISIGLDIGNWKDKDSTIIWY